MLQTFSYIDLFAGCGGLSLGLHNAGWNGLFAIEKSPDAFETLKHNLIEKKKHFSWVDWLPKKHHDINNVLRRYKLELESLRGTVDLIAGGPPCQGFSMAGRRNESDQRNDLIKSYIRFIRLVKPKLIFFENVKGFTLEFKKNREKGKVYSGYVKRKLELAGYHVHGELVNFGEYGVPQNRTRFIMVGVRKDLPYSSVSRAEEFFSKLRENRIGFLKGKNLPVSPTLKDAISDLLRQNGTVVSADTNSFQAGTYSAPNSSYQQYMRKDSAEKVVDSHRFANHRLHIVERLKYILEVAEKNRDLNSQIREEFKITKHTLVPLDAMLKCRTLTSNPDDLIHYSEPRSLTVREYARIQGFPDSFHVKGKYTTGGMRRRVDVPRYTQIGNSISPIFGEQSGLILKQLL